MDVSPATVSSTAFSGNTLVVSSDRALAGRLRGILEKDHQCRVELAYSFGEAEAMLETKSPQTVFLDLRTSSAGEDPSRLLHHLSQRGKDRVPVVAVSDAGYVCDWAAVADLLVQGHLHLPLDRRQLANLLEAELSQNSSAAVPGPTTPRVVRSRSVTYKTHTPEMSELLDNVVRMSSQRSTRSPASRRKPRRSVRPFSSGSA